MSILNKPKAYLGNGHYIFVSYSHKDAERVYPLISLLQQEYNVWFDEGLHFGREWDEEIVGKIDSCSLFIFMITENSLASKNCKDEIVFAKQNDIPFINILMDDIELPKIFEFRYGRFQMLKYFEYIDINEVLEDLKRRSEEIEITRKDNKEEITKVEIKKETSSFSHKEATNYALFNFEKEVTIFPIYDKEKELVIKEEQYFDDHGKRIYRLVFLPSNNMASPVNRVKVLDIDLVDSLNNIHYYFSKEEGIDGSYAFNVLNRGYNCINVDFKTDKDVPYLLSKCDRIKLKTVITSIFNVDLQVNFEIFLKGEKDVTHNPDLEEIPELKTFIVHRSIFTVVR